MFRSRTALAVATIFIATAIAAPPAFALKPTDGAYGLSLEDVKKSGSILCGRFLAPNSSSSVFKPGRWVSKAPKDPKSWAQFIPYDREAANYLAMSKKKKYSKSKRASYAKKAKASKSLATAHTAKCKYINALKFSPTIATAKGIAIRGTENSNFSMQEKSSAASTSKSNIFAINANGEMVQAIVNGYPEATMARVSPDGSLYIALQGRINLLDVDGGNGSPGSANECSIIRIPNGSSTPSCVDTVISSIRTDFSEAIQFTSNGTMAYLAETDRGPIVRKRATNGTISNVTSSVGGVNIEQFRLLENGQILVGGSTESNGLRWVKLYKTNGTSSTLIPNYPRFIKIFPDGKAYIGAEEQNGVRVYDPSSQALEATYYMTSELEPNPPVATFYTGAMCNSEIPGMCDGGGAARSFATTTDQRVFAMTGNDDRALIQFYPSSSIQTINLSDVMSRPTLMIAAGNKLVVAGVTSESKNVLYLVDPSTGQKTVLRSAATDFETYHIKYRASTNELLYDGLKTNNTFVLVKRNLATNVETEQVVGSIRLLDLDVR
jgi:hypothetical protein